MRTGFGWDIHRLKADRPLILGGLIIPSDRGEDAHSDGDVLTHALIDALLGAAALGDIGEHFPPTEARWADVSSMLLLEQVMGMLGARGYRVVNADCIVVLERPRLSAYKKAIAANLARALSVAEDLVAIKAKTKEGMDAVGEGRAIEAYAAVLLE